MYRKVLVPLDGSELAEQVLPHAEALARALGSEIVLFRVPLYAYEVAASVPGTFAHMPVPVPEGRDAAVKEAEEYLNKIKLSLVLHGLKVSTVVKEGLVGETIVHFAHDEHADLIAMSTHGRTGLRRVVFGSVAEEVLHKTGIPVLLIRP